MKRYVMSHAPKTPEHPASLARGNFTYCPVIPGRLEFSVELRRAILRERPRIVAVELPGELEDVYLQALARLPEMTIILYPDPNEDERGVYVAVQPWDAFTEAVRSGLEVDAEVVFIEPDLGDRPHLPDTYPDPYSIRYIGMDKYVEAYRIYPQARNEEIAAHAAGIAWKLQGTDPSGAVFVVLSLNLLDPVLDAMEVPQDPPARRDPAEIRLLNPHPDCLAEITLEYPYLQDRYGVIRIQMANVHPVYRDLIDRPKMHFDLLRDAKT